MISIFSYSFQSDYDPSILEVFIEINLVKLNASNAPDRKVFEHEINHIEYLLDDLKSDGFDLVTYSNDFKGFSFQTGIYKKRSLTYRLKKSYKQ